VTTRRLDRFGHAQQAHALLSPTPMENTGS
jgi:hypothetical protein